MTDAYDTAEHTFRVGDVVMVPTNTETNSYYYYALPGEPYKITRVYKNRVEVRGNFGSNRYATVANYHDRVQSLKKTEVIPWDGIMPRKLGEMPAVGDHISQNDPRIAWFFEDAAKLAEQRGLCSSFDDLAETLNFPGREKTYRIATTADVNGVTAKISVKARSKAEAQQKAQALLLEPVKFTVTDAQQEE